MPSKIRPDDWDRLFAPNAPRRGGPLRVLVNVIVTLVILATLSGGAVFAINYRQQQFRVAAATATVVAATVYPARTATAIVEAQTATARVAQRTATAIAKQATPTPSALTATVFNGGNVREAPVSGRPIDQVNASETVQLLAKNADGSWYQIKTARNVTGWVSQTLLTIDPAVAQQVPVAQ